MSEFDFDLFVIGAGSGGVRASRIAASHGARVAVAEEEYRVGGTCVIRGCVPKKLLVYGAHFAEDLKDARKFGWTSPTANSTGSPPRQCPRRGRPARGPVWPDARQSQGHALQDARNGRRPAEGAARRRAGNQRQKHIDRDRRLAARPRIPGQRTCDHVERGLPSRNAAEACRDRGRRLYRQRVRRHLQRIRQQGDDRQPRRHDPARL